MKSQRQAKILEIISNKNIETQEQLLAELQAEGFRGTQATISRDIKELQIVKSLDGMGGYRYGIPQKNEHDRFGARFRVIFKECVNSLDYAQNLIVVKTMPGLGNAAGANIDALKMPTVLGTLSGDDTTLVIMRDSESAADFCNEIRRMLE